NLPVATQVVGARASRTTHPRFLRLAEELLTRLLGAPFRIGNPYVWETKGDVVRRLEAAGCADLIRHSGSCALPRESTREHPHCGRCSQCVLRRFAVLATGLGEHDPGAGYREDLLTGPCEDPRDRTLLAAFAETARQVRRLSATQFFARYGEASR